MKIKQLFTILFVANLISFSNAIRVRAQNTERVINNNNENVDISVQESGSQSQGQSSNGNTSDVTVTDNEKSDNFWSDSYRGRLSVPSGSASLTCGEQIISFSRSGGFGLGVGAVGINFSDNSGSLPEEFHPSLAEIRQCAKEKNAAEILDKYIELKSIDKAIANTYLRTVSPEIYATFFVENSKDSGEILSPKTFSNLSTNLRNEEFDRVVEWQDNFHGVGLAEKRVELRENQELRSTERKKRLVELEVLELERRSQEVEAILKQRQSQLNNLLRQYKQPN
ncbi:hypothetical protein I4641_04595 [Waterburya agarophytonicola K14]|uniref:Uncharacterized protein n=1 Tax=Waterburya agarophytonicola KI4 TaxID=2874699 RepID=A0A964BMK6_9CYAN|nr:hypothetical protein [Waterburya agarophytonicola]MCC0176254.1 hypothetical protein [Waterburya agarophytonicola KI4]